MTDVLLALTACVPASPEGSAAPRVVAVYPANDTIPENVLRFYVTFSEPMREGNFLDHIRLERVDTNEDLTGVFFDNIHELWSADRRRITLLVDPGRVKTGLRAHRELGRAFEAGGRYRLRVLDTWRSTHGEPLGGEFVHDFGVGAEDRTPVDPSNWCLKVPEAGSVAPLHVDFGEPVDHVSVHHLLRVVDPEEMPLRGRWSLEDNGRDATWTPASPWATQLEAHAIRVHGRFEDIAGNNVNAAFEHSPGAIPHGNEGRTRTRRFGVKCPADAQAS